MSVPSGRTRVLRIARFAPLALLVPLAALAQGTAGGRVRGVVVGTDGVAVRDAVVTLLGRGASMRTSTAGVFLFERVRPGKDTLSVRAVGFQPRLHEIRVAVDSGWEGRVVLSRLAQALPNVSVRAAGELWKYDDFFRRQRLGSGTFRTRDDFEKMGASDIVSALRSIPGVNISATANPNGETEIRWRIARCPGQPPNIAIYLNGIKLSNTGASANKGSELSGLFRSRGGRSTCEECARMGDLFASLPLMDIMFLEFYRGPGQIPNDLDRGDSCAALVIWTR